MITLNGNSLTIEHLTEAARGETVKISDQGRKRMMASRALMETEIAGGKSIYGVTTGLGARVVENLGPQELESFSIQTLRGRAHSVGEEESRENVRAGMIVRLNTLLGGYSGVRVEIAEHIAACLNAGLTPVVGKIGSIGAADLVINATVGLALMGEGKIHTGEDVGDAAEVLQAQGIKPLKLLPREGLALASHSGAVSGAAAMAFSEMDTVCKSAQTAAALSIEAFRANLSSIDPRALSAKPLPGQMVAAEDLAERLVGSHLFDLENARRLQDPLSFRNIPQIHGGLFSALNQAREIIEIEINGSSDNPLTLVESEEVLSCGLFFTTELGLACEAVNRAANHVAAAQVARLTKLLDARLSDLPTYLALPDGGSAGFAPLMKPAEAILAEIAHVSSSPPVYPSVGASGVEDCQTTAPVAVRSMARISELMTSLIAIELIIATQAIEMRGCIDDLGEHTANCFKKVREFSVMLVEDRSMADDVELVVTAIHQQEFV